MEVVETYTANIGAFVGMVIEHAFRTPRKVTVNMLIAHVDPDTQKVVIGESDIQESVVCDGFWDGVGRAGTSVISVEMDYLKARIELHTKIDTLFLVKMDDGRQIIMSDWAFKRKDDWIHFEV